jgi:uncharacterized membrane protein
MKKFYLIGHCLVYSSIIVFVVFIYTISKRLHEMLL